jgi:hypothetical protein
MSPTISELQDVLDWEAVSVLHAVEQRDGATMDAVVDATDLEREAVANRCQQLLTLGLLAEVDEEGGDLYDVTGAGHGAIGGGLYDEYDLLGEADLDELAERVAELLDRRADLKAAVDDLRADAEELQEKADRAFGDRDDVAEEFEALMADIEDLAAAIAEE